MDRVVLYYEAARHFDNEEKAKAFADLHCISNFRIEPEPIDPNIIEIKKLKKEIQKLKKEMK